MQNKKNLPQMNDRSHFRITMEAAWSLQPNFPEPALYVCEAER